jgi:hypothetical protein
MKHQKFTTLEILKKMCRGDYPPVISRAVIRTMAATTQSKESTWLLFQAKRHSENLKALIFPSNPESFERLRKEARGKADGTCRRIAGLNMDGFLYELGFRRKEVLP